MSEESPTKIQPLSITFVIPPEHTDDRDPISIMDKTKLRRKLFKDAFLLGLLTRNKLEMLQSQDKQLFWKPHYFYSTNHDKIICDKINKQTIVIPKKN